VKTRQLEMKFPRPAPLWFRRRQCRRNRVRWWFDQMHSAVEQAPDGVAAPDWAPEPRRYKITDGFDADEEVYHVLASR
jgi:hypothetical protein